jgi:hypothetical protein
MARRWRKMLVALALGLAATGIVAVVLRFIIAPPRAVVAQPSGDLPGTIDGGSEPVHGQFEGHNKTRIVERFGLPTEQWEGHYGNPPASYKRQYAGAIALVYRRTSGSLYLFFCLQEGDWVCFSSDWLPKRLGFLTLPLPHKRLDPCKSVR